jgi:hypothetical protein
MIFALTTWRCTNTCGTVWLQRFAIKQALCKFGAGPRRQRAEGLPVRGFAR